MELSLRVPPSGRQADAVQGEKKRMSWQPEIDELHRRKEMAKAMGGAEGIARQRRQGKLTVRERIAALADPGSFDEFMGFSGTGSYEGGKLTHFTPKPSVDGTMRLDGRKVVVSAGDFTVRGGSAGRRGAMGQELSATQRAVEWQLPYIRLLDASGGSVRTFEEYGRTYLPDGNAFTVHEVRALSVVPTVSAVLGSVAGLPAINACLAHFNVMVKDISQIFPGGPPVVKAALGIDITKEELGGDYIHTRISGCIDNLAETESDAFEQIRRFLSYLPSSVNEMAPRGPTDDDPARANDALLSILPRNRRQSYDARALLKLVVDKNSFFEIAPLYGRARITGLARIDGFSVGIMANNPRFNGGSTDVAAGSKAMRLMQLCDTFHLPLISLADEPGFMVGPESERLGIERAGARLVATVCNSRMPWITIVLGKLYGVAGQCHHRPSGMFRRYAWPSANWGSMHIAGGVSAAYRREIADAPDPGAKQQEIEARLQALASPFLTAEATGQDIIDPRTTRARLVEFVRDAQRVLMTQVGPPVIPYLP
jgi:acetyl-CoA carboxylase carboxyltransferase component